MNVKTHRISKTASRTTNTAGKTTNEARRISNAAVRPKNSRHVGKIMSFFLIAALVLTMTAFPVLPPAESYAYTTVSYNTCQNVTDSDYPNLVEGGLTKDEVELVIEDAVYSGGYTLDAKDLAGLRWDILYEWSAGGFEGVFTEESKAEYGYDFENNEAVYYDLLNSDKIDEYYMMWGLPIEVANKYLSFFTEMSFTPNMKTRLLKQEKGDIYGFENTGRSAAYFCEAEQTAAPHAWPKTEILYANYNEDFMHIYLSYREYSEKDYDDWDGGDYDGYDDDDDYPDEYYDPYYELADLEYLDAKLEKDDNGKFRLVSVKMAEDPAGFINHPLVALKTSDGHYLSADIGSDFGSAPLKSDSTEIHAWEEFYLVSCFTDFSQAWTFALKSSQNRRYLTKERNHELEFESDFVKDEEKFHLSWNYNFDIKYSAKGVPPLTHKLSFGPDDDYYGTNTKWLCFEDGEAKLTSDESKAEPLTIVFRDANDYSQDDVDVLTSGEWFDMDEKGTGYWDIQRQVGLMDSEVKKGADRVAALKELGYETAAYGDYDIVSIDNMQCSIGAKKMDSGPYDYDLIIAFQGTGGYDPSGLPHKDIASNLTSGINELGMHKGYYTMAEKLWDKSQLIRIDMKEGNGYVLTPLYDLLCGVIEGSVHLTLLGHSMGGAIAQCFAELLLNKTNNIDEAMTFKQNVTGRTFESAIAISFDDPEYTDWINLGVDTDTVPNGVVKGSLLGDHGVHSIGRNIWLHDDRADEGTADKFMDNLVEDLGNISGYKHNMGGNELPYKLMNAFQAAHAPKKSNQASNFIIRGIKNKTYTGKALKQNIKVTYHGRALKQSTKTEAGDYTVSYKNNKNVGIASVTIKGQGRFRGTVKKTFKISPKGTSITKLTKGKKRLTVKWKKKTAQTTGYQIRCCLKKDFKKGVKKATIKKAKTTKAVIKGLKSKKKYYVQVRTYKTVKGTKYYSAWSESKTVKTK